MLEKLRNLFSWADSETAPLLYKEAATYGEPIVHTEICAKGEVCLQMLNDDAQVLARELGKVIENEEWECTCHLTDQKEQAVKGAEQIDARQVFIDGMVALFILKLRSEPLEMVEIGDRVEAMIRGQASPEAPVNRVLLIGEVTGKVNHITEGKVLYHIFDGENHYNVQEKHIIRHV